ncbi:MAG: PIG-L family deacetylase [Acidobacteriaceae bacterium]
MTQLRRSITTLLSRTFALALASVFTASTLAAQVVPWQTQNNASAWPQPLPIDRGADGLAQTLKKLTTWGSVMMIVAHPDDEDAGLLTTLSRGDGATTELYTITRGEGGQDAMSSATNDALGLIRTNELLSADRYYGTEQVFSPFIDYGFSKTIAEAHQKWGDQNVLCNVVRAVRLYRPTILVSVFVGGITDGHGHHQVAGEMNQRAFALAGNPSVCPSQIAAGLQPWSPYKVYARVPFFSPGPKGMYDYATHKWAPIRFYNYVTKKWTDHVPSASVKIQEGQWSPLLGQSYIQIARTGWGMHKSQFGGGFTMLPGPSSVSYHLYGSRVPKSAETYNHGLETSLFDGINTSLTGIAALAHSGNTAFLVSALRQISAHVEHASAVYQPTRPEAIAPDLAAGLRETRDLIDAVNKSNLSSIAKTNITHVLRVKTVQFNTALAEALGLQIRAYRQTTTQHSNRFFGNLVPQDTPEWVTRGESLQVRVTITAAQSFTPTGPLQFKRAWLANPNGEHWPVQQISAPATNASATDAVFQTTVPASAIFTRPYFTRPNVEQAHYNIRNPKWLGRPFAPYPLAGWAEFTYNGVPIRIGQVVQTAHRENGLGQISWPLAVVPELSVNLTRHAGVVPIGSHSFPLSVSVSNNTQQAESANLHLNLPAGWSANPSTQPLTLAAGDSQSVTFHVDPDDLTTDSYNIQAVATSGATSYTEGFQQVGYAGLRPYYLYKPSAYLARGVDIKVAPSLKVAYVMGTGDRVPEALAEIGIHPTLLSDADLATGNLNQYHTIIIGIRAYSNRPALFTYSQRLLQYVHNGGNLIVQYQRTRFSSAAPYHIHLGNNPEEVVVETQPVKILKPGDPLLNYPNKITSADFNNWIEERGHSFLTSWDSHYTALTETHDPGQAPQDGGLVYTHYGKGTYTYVAFALYRQLNQAVTGAFRLFANLIAAK